ncbi:hypothetical protein O9X98_15690 [Agrobacterium salinitolerans]|nr:hypothetical protein [Agrobacterium salinitolerans]
MKEPVSTFAPTLRFDIFIAGDYHLAKDICRKWALEVGACVTVERVDYVYSGGEEAGVRIGLINYPRFPTTYEELKEKTRDIANRLMIGLSQLSYSIVGPDETEWVSRRPA